MLRFDERVHLPKNRENTITFLVNGEPIGTVETLAPGAKTVDIPIPPIDYDSVIDALGYIPYNSTNPNSYITSSALNGYATETWVGQQGYLTGINSSDITTALGYTPSDSTLSNVVAIDAGSAVQTALDDKVSKTGDTMSGRLHFASNSIIDLRETFKFEDIILGTVPSETHFSGFQTFDSQDYEFANVLCSYNSDGRVGANFYVRKPISGGSVTGSMGVYINAQDEVYSTFPHTDCVDGQWVYKNTSLASSVTWNTSSHSSNKSYSLSSYLPNDGQKYEVIIRAQGSTTSTSGKFISVGILSDIITTQIYTCRCRTRSSSSVNCSGNVILPVGTGRKIYVNGCGSETSAGGTYDVACIGYRRIGTNN